MCQWYLVPSTFHILFVFLPPCLRLLYFVNQEISVKFNTRLQRSVATFEQILHDDKA